MFYVRKPKQISAIIIRQATEAELANYEKQKLIRIGDSEQVNKIEPTQISGKTQYINPLTKKINAN